MAKDIVAQNESKEPLNYLTTSNDLLIDAQWPQLTVNEQRLVVFMLSLIRRDDKDFKPYQIAIKDLSNLLGERKDLYQRFEEATDGLMNKIIRWQDPTDKNHSLKAVWCSSAGVHRGKGLVYLNFDPQLKPFLLALKGNFTNWGEPRAVIGLKNHYCLRIYQYIKYHQGMSTINKKKSVLVELDWFKKYLSTPEGSYSNFSHFRLKILEPVKKDIAAKTDIEVSYQSKKTGRKVTHLIFTWKKNKRFRQMKLPGLTDGGKSSVEDILVYEFGISSEDVAAGLVKKYGYTCVEEAIEASHEYIRNLMKKGQKIKNSAGIVRKAIEEGWQPIEKSVIETTIIEQEQAQLTADIKSKRQIEEKENEEAQREEERAQLALEKFDNASEAVQKEILSSYREQLVSLGNKQLVRAFDKTGRVDESNPAMYVMFKLHLKEHFLSED